MRFTTFTRACCALLPLLAAPAASAQDAQPLRWKFEVGDKLRYTMDQDMDLSMGGGPLGNITSSVEQNMDMSWTVEGVNDEGEAVIRQKINRVEMKMTGPVSFSYDSNSEEPPSGMAAMVAPMFDAMTEGDFEITMTARGEVKDVKIPDKVLESLKNSPGAAQMGEVGTADGFKKLLTQGAFVLPEGDLEPGQSWTSTVEVNNPMAGKQTVDTTYTYEGTKEVDGKKFAVFKPQLTMNFAGGANVQMNVKDQKSSGEVLFNIEEGRLHSSALDQDVTMEVSVAGQTMEQKINQKIRITVKPDDEAAGSGAAGEPSAQPAEDAGEAE